MVELVLVVMAALGCVLLGGAILVAALVLLLADVRLYVAMSQAYAPHTRRSLLGDVVVASFGLVLSAYGVCQVLAVAGML